MLRSKPAIAAMVLILAACGNQGSGKQGSADKGSGTDANKAAIASTGNNVGVRTKVLAAVEPFETLTETAFTATAPELAKSIDATDAAARSIATLVPGDVAQRLQAQSAAIHRAQTSGQRADVALASIEGFREVVGAVPAGAPIPADVSLLDYAGLRYDSDVQANPPRWDDTAKAIIYARERTAALAPLAQAAPLLPAMNAAISGMKTAASAHDAARARAGAKVELDLVDKLEATFAPPVAR